MAWEERIEVKRGNFGERIVDEFLVGNGIVPYAPASVGAHPFDRLCATADKSQIFIAEVKTKPRRKYREDTGINVKAFEEYAGISERHKIQVWLFFVDEYTKSVYCGDLSEISTPRVVDGCLYPLRERTRFGRDIMYFPLSAMETLFDLSDEQLKEITGMESSRRYGYANDNARDAEVASNDNITTPDTAQVSAQVARK